MTYPTSTPHFDLDQALVEKPSEGIYRANRSIFVDEELFELEMKHIFEGNWIYLAHESQLPTINDYHTTTIGRPLVQGASVKAMLAEANTAP